MTGQGDDMQDMQIMSMPKMGGSPNNAQSMAMQVVTTDAQAAATAIVAQEQRKMMLGLADAQVRMRMIDRSADVEQTRLTEDGMTQRLDIQEDHSTKRWDLTAKVDTFRIEQTNETKRIGITADNETKRLAINTTKDIELKRIEAENDFTKGIKQWVILAVAGTVVLKGPRALVPSGGGKLFWIILAVIIYYARRVYINGTELANDPKRLLSVTVLGLASRSGFQGQLPGPLADAKKWLENNAARPDPAEEKEPPTSVEVEMSTDMGKSQTLPAPDIERSVTDPTPDRSVTDMGKSQTLPAEKPAAPLRSQTVPLATADAQPPQVTRSSTSLSGGSPTNIPEGAELKEVLDSRGLAEYMGKMDELGYDLDVLKDLGDADLESMFKDIGCKPGHKVKFKNLVKRDLQTTTTN